MNAKLPPSTRAPVLSAGAPTKSASPEQKTASRGDDDKLIHDLVAHKEEGWREFFARFDRVIRSAIRGAIRRMQGRVSEDDYKEIHATFVATLFANDHRKLSVFDPARGRSISSWLALLAERTTVDWVRAVRAQERAHRAWMFESLTTEVDHPRSDEILDRKRRLERAREALPTLAPRQLELFELYFAEGLDISRVAERMGISVQTVHSSRNKIETHLTHAAWSDVGAAPMRTGCV